MIAASLWLFLVGPTLADDGTALSEHLVEVLPPLDVVGDPSAPVVVYAVALGSDGRALAGLSLKLQTDEGDASGWEDLGYGSYSFLFTPPAEAGEVSITLKGKAPDKAAIQSRWTLPVSAAAPVALGAEHSPAAGLLLGAEAHASATFQGGAPGAEILVRSSTGEVGEPHPVGDGAHHVRIALPKSDDPQLAIVTAVDERGTGDAYGWTAMPLSGTRVLSLSGEAGIPAVVTVADRLYGPVVADDKGEASLQVSVPPGVRHAMVRWLGEEPSAEVRVELDVQAARTIALFPTSADFPADPTASFDVRAIVLSADGVPDVSGGVHFESSHGSFGGAEHAGNGVYLARFTPPGLAETTAATITVRQGSEERQTDTMDVRLLAAAPRSLEISVDPPELGPETGKLTAKATVEAGPAGAGQVAFDANGALVRGKVRTEEGGFAVDLDVERATGVRVYGYAAREATANPLRHVFLLPADGRLKADGLSEVALVVATTDRWGQPVANVDVALSVVDGGGLPPTVTTDGHGLARVLYTASQEPGLVRIRAEAGRFGGWTALLQLPDGTESVDLPTGGRQEARHHAESWAPLVDSVLVPPQGAQAPEQ
jgi:hypothetical protein